MLRNTANQKWRVFAFYRATNLPYTGGASSITAKLSLDYANTQATTDVNPTEVEDGYYYFNLEQAETDAHNIEIYPESSTSGVQVIGIPGSYVTNREVEILAKLNTGLKNVLSLNLVLDGDSNTSGSFGTPYQSNLTSRLNALGYLLTINNVAVSGYKYKNVIAHYNSLVKPLFDPNKENVYVVNAGNNDFYITDGLSYTRTIYGATVVSCAIDSLETVQAYVLQLVSLAKADGWKIKLATVPVRPPQFTDYRTWMPDRRNLNNWLRAECVPRGLLEGVALGDWASDPNLEYKPHAPGDVDPIYDDLIFRYNGQQFPSLYYSTAYYLGDLTHLNATGAAAVTTLDAAAISSLLQQPTNETLLKKLNALKGPGDKSWSITVKTGSGIIIPQCACWVATDEDGDNVITDKEYTNNLGVVEFLLDPGTYYLFRQKTGYTFDNPKEFTVV